MRLVHLPLLLAALAVPALAATFPTTWTPVAINPGDGGVEYLGDPAGDGQGNGRDIVGTNENPAFYVASDATHFFFRIRLDLSPLQSENDLRPYGWGILIDADGDVRDYDFLLMVNGITETLDYRQKTTKTLAGDPSETADVTLLSTPLVYTGPTHNIQVGPAGSSINGTPDFFLDVAISLSSFYGVNPDGGAYLNFSPSTPLMFWVGVSNSSQSIQTDLGGTLLAPGAGTLPGTVSNPVLLCTTDSACGGTTSGLICVTGTCASGCRGTDGNGCPAGQTCSSTDSTPGTCNLDPPPPAPVVLTPANGAQLADNSPTFTGTATPGTLVRVYVDLVLMGSTTAAGDGTWSFTLTGDLTDGVHGASATATNISTGATSARSATNTFLVDTTAPDAPTISSPVSGSATSDTTPVVSGTAEAGSTVRVFVDGSATPACTTTASSTGAWSCEVTPALTQGAHTVTATATDGVGNVSAPTSTVTVTIDTTAPAAPTLSAPADGAHLASASVTITGTAEAGSTVTVILDGSVAGTTTASGTGAWSFSPASSLTEGSHTVRVTATDAAGNVSPSSPTNGFTVDLTAPVAPAVASPANGSVTNTATPTLSGTAEPGSTVTVTLDGAVIGTAVATSAGTWSLTPPSSLTEGPHTVSATATDAAGNVSPASATGTFTVDLTAPASPTLASPANGAVVATASPAISGTAEAGSTVTVILDGLVVGTATASSTGAWSFTLPASLADGAHTVRATSTDGAGNVSASSPTHTFTVDTQAPAAPVIGSPATGTTTSDTTPTLTGTAEAGSTVRVFVDGGTTPACTATASSTGAWSCTVSPALTEGSHAFTATATDAAGNVSPGSSGVTLVIDATPPGAPTITTPVSGTVTREATPLVSGTAEAGSTVTVFLDGSSTPACTVVASTTGEWSCAPLTPLADGPHTVVVRTTDGAGNASPPAGSSFSVDTQAPAAPALLAPLEGATTSPFPTFSGTAEAGSTVRIFVDGATAPACTAIATPLGAFTCVAQAALAAGSRSATATATDAAGNASGTSAPRTFVVGATQPPGPPVVLAPAAGSSTSDTTPTVSGFAAPGSSVRVFVDGEATPACTATADAQGAFACDVAPALAAGAHSLVATASDASGTSGPSAPVLFTVDTQAPAAPAITAPAPGDTTGPQPLVRGTAEAGATVTVFFDGATTAACTALADASGAWACASSVALSLGAHVVTARATDAAGNASAPSADVGFTVAAGQAPAAPLLTSPAPDALLADATPRFSGTAAPLSAVAVYVDGATTPACTTTADSQGRFACTPLTALPDGAHSATATASDGTATSPPSPTVPFTIDTTPPATPVVTSPAVNASTGRQPTLAGTAEAGSTVVVRVDGLVVCQVTASSTGAWSCTLTQPLAPGAHEATATATDAAGNTSAPSSAVPFTVLAEPRAPVLVQPAAGATTTDTTPTFVGLAEPNSQVTVRVDGVVVCTATADGAGGFSCTPATPLALGAHSATVTNETAGGSASSAPRAFTVVAEPPPAPTVTSPSSGQRTSDRTPTVQGTAEPGATVRVFIDGVEVCTATADAQGRFSCAPTTPLAAGDHVVTATTTTGTGTSPPSAAVTFTVTHTPPVLTTPVDGATVTPNPTFTGTATPGSQVTVFVNGEAACTATAAADGTWSCQAQGLPPGTHAVSVRTVDGEGTTLDSAPRSVVVPPLGVRGGGCDCSAGGLEAIAGLAALLAGARRRRRGPSRSRGG